MLDPTALDGGYDLIVDWYADPEAIARDPMNGIATLLQPDDIAARDAREIGVVVAATTERFVEAVAGTAERREVHAAVLVR